MKEFSKTDERNILSGYNDPKVLFLALDHAKIPTRVEVITNKTKLDDILQKSFWRIQ